MRLPGQRRVRRSAVRFTPKRFADRARALGGWLAARRRAVSARVCSRGALARARRCLALLWRRKVDAGSSRLGQSDGDRLLGGSRAVLAFADVVHLFADELAGLRRRRLAFALVTLCSFQCFFLWHDVVLSNEEVSG